MRQKLLINTAVSIGMAAWFAASAVMAADLAERQPPVCRGGVLTDALTGRPVFDRTRKDPTPIPCGPAPQAELDPLLLAGGAVALAGLGVGICAAAGCFNSHNPPPFFPPPPPPPASFSGPGTL